MIAKVWHTGTGLALAAAAMLTGTAPVQAANGSLRPAAAPMTDTVDGQTDRLCAGYGKDFVRVSGTSTCVKASGYVQVDGYRQSLPTGDPLSPALRSR